MVQNWIMTPSDTQNSKRVLHLNIRIHDEGVTSIHHLATQLST